MNASKRLHFYHLQVGDFTNSVLGEFLKSCVLSWHYSIRVFLDLLMYFRRHRLFANVPLLAYAFILRP